jgi:KDO2-lipid IV(A) lauroyltransferase
VKPALELPRTGDREADITAGMEIMAGVLENVISQHPEQWLLAKPAWPMEGCNGIP